MQLFSVNWQGTALHLTREKMEQILRTSKSMLGFRGWTGFEPLSKTLGETNCSREDYSLRVWEGMKGSLPIPNSVTAPEDTRPDSKSTSAPTMPSQLAIQFKLLKTSFLAHPWCTNNSDPCNLSPTPKVSCSAESYPSMAQLSWSLNTTSRLNFFPTHGKEQAPCKICRWMSSCSALFSTKVQPSNLRINTLIEHLLIMSKCVLFEVSNPRGMSHFN